MELSEINYTAKDAVADSATLSKQIADPPGQRQKPSSASKNVKTNSYGSLNKSLTSSITKQGLRARTRSVDQVKTSDLKGMPAAKNPHLSTKTTGGPTGRQRSQSEKRGDETRKSPINRSQRQLKLTIPHTPQLLK